MIIKDCIRETKVAQGDLVFIYHKTKPYKTGWWRKIRSGSGEDKIIYYILEKPMHKNFNMAKASVQSHVEKELCLMTDKTLKNGIEHDKYEILADVRGVQSVSLSTRGYQLKDRLFTSKIHVAEDKENIFVTKRFEELIELYGRKKEQLSDIKILVEGLI